MELADATAPLSRYARSVKKGPLVLTRRGLPVAALLPIQNADSETVALSTNPTFLALIERSRRRQKAEGGISGTEMRRRLGASGQAQHRASV
jgi:antitoxin (DNA-binding transcriptional repressor) of toxin-antitoxin stability system